MSRWMLELSEKERERRAKFSAFMKAVPGFIAALAQELKLGADAYNEQFPDENSVDVNRMPGGRIQVICSGRDGLRSAAIVTLNADTQRVACSFENIQHVNWEDILDVAGDASSLHSMGIGQAHTIASLARKILIPLLFPGLLSDPTARQYLNR
jgi:hypothetical protein